MFPNSRNNAFVMMLSLCLGLLGVNSHSEVVTVYNQPVSSSGGLYQSSRLDSNGSDYDQYVWDDFTIQSTTSISEIHWTGAYDPVKFGAGGKVLDFSVAFFSSIAAGSQPDLSNGKLVEYHTNGNANETAVDSLSGVRYYTYSFVLPTSLTVAAGTKYWVQIEAFQHGIPDWELAAATGGNGAYFRRTANAGDIFYQAATGDATFSLVSQSASTQTTGWRDPWSGGILSSTHVTFSPMGVINFFASTRRIIFVEDLLGRTMRGVGMAGLRNTNGNVRLPSGVFIIKSAGNDPTCVQ
jgi:hypothetical protein